MPVSASGARLEQRAAEAGAAAEVEHRGVVPARIGQVLDHQVVALVAEDADQMVVELFGVVVEQAFDVGGRRGRGRRGAADAGEEPFVQLRVAAALARLRVRLRRLLEPTHLAQQAAALAPHLGQLRRALDHTVVGGEGLLLQTHAGQGDGADAEGIDVARLCCEHRVGRGDRLDRPVHPQACRAEVEQGRDPARHRLEGGEEGALGILETARLQGRQALQEQLLARFERRGARGGGSDRFHLRPV